MSEALSFSSRFPGSFEGAASASEWLHRVSTEAALPGKLVFAIEVCLEELFTNVARYGAVGTETAASLAVELTLQVAPDIALVVEDNARPFDVSAAPVRPIAAEVAQVQPGGLGMELLRKFSQGLRHEALPHGNRVTVTFLRPEAPGPNAEVMTLSS